MKSQVEIRANRLSESVPESIDVRFLRHAIEGDLSQLIVQENANGSGCCDLQLRVWVSRS